MDNLTLPFLVSTAMYALREHGSYTSTVGAPPLIQRFVALKDLDDTTDDAVTWVRDPKTTIEARYGLAIVPKEWNPAKSRPGSLIACDDPHRAFFTLMRMVYGGVSMTSASPNDDAGR